MADKQFPTYASHHDVLCFACGSRTENPQFDDRVDSKFRATCVLCGANNYYNLANSCTPSSHHIKMRTGDYSEGAGGALYCEECGKRIGQFRQ
jgi:hypothetical protein